MTESEALGVVHGMTELDALDDEYEGFDCSSEPTDGDFWDKAYGAHRALAMAKISIIRMMKTLVLSS